MHLTKPSDFADGEVHYACGALNSSSHHGLPFRALCGNKPGLWLCGAMRHPRKRGAGSPHGLRKASCRRLAEAGCSPHEIMPVSGHETLKEVERYTKSAYRARLANSAIAAVKAAQEEALKPERCESELANTPGIVSQNSDQAIDLKEKTTS